MDFDAKWLHPLLKDIHHVHRSCSRQCRQKKLDLLAQVDPNCQSHCLFKHSALRMYYSLYFYKMGLVSATCIQTVLLFNITIMGRIWMGMFSFSVQTSPPLLFCCWNSADCSINLTNNKWLTVQQLQRHHLQSFRWNQLLIWSAKYLARVWNIVEKCTLGHFLYSL